MSLVSRPGRSMIQMWSAASWALSPSALIAWAIRSAMPIPAAPPPKMTISCSVSRPPGDAHARQHARQADRRGALDVVVERAQRVAVALEDAAGLRAGEVLPVQDRVREALARGGDVRVDERVVLGAAHARASQPEVARVGEQLFAVRADVEADGEHAGRVDPGRHRVDGELADRDVDAADAPVADAEDRLAVGGDDQVDVVGPEPGGLHRPVDPVDVVDVEEQPARAAEQMAELLDRRPDRRACRRSAASPRRARRRGGRTAPRCCRAAA